MASINSFQDLSGTPATASGNPYSALIKACAGEPQFIQHRYRIHRASRNEQQREKILDPNFGGWLVDPVLQKLVESQQHPDFVDPRNCLVFWARPPMHVRRLIGIVQEKLLDLIPSLWLMPLDCLHMTALEMIHSRTKGEIEELVHAMESKISEITDYTFDHRARLVMPMLSYDDQAIALSFLPACGQGIPGAPANEADAYTYHHLRSDLYDLCSSTGAVVTSRYIVPSAHLTVARFITQQGFSRDETGEIVDPTYTAKWIQLLAELNAWLQEGYWPKLDYSIKPGGEWIVGSEQGLECRKGTLWYGGGERVRLGRGFDPAEGPESTGRNPTVDNGDSQIIS